MLAVRFAMLALLVGCIEPHLTPCGDLDCPGGTVCLVDRCVTPQQLAGCTGKAEGDGCAVDTKVGVCANGACTFGGCGNSKLDPGEVCDDGNTAFGDGCSADCASLETCGNGVVDVALGEGCDCGTNAASRPIGCRLVNSDDPEAECTTGCQPRFCGDGAVDVLEQCDGTDLGTSTCADFGYYRGAPTCSTVCQLEITGCDGRCGDGAVEPAFGEFCDQAPPAGTCLTYGYDAGYVGCSQACSVDAGHCERFGWVQLETGDIKSVWASSTQTLVVAPAAQGGTNAWMVINGIRELSPAGTYLLAAGDGTRAYAIAADRIAVWSGTSWSMATVGWTAASPSAAFASATLGLYAVVGGRVWRYSAGAWTDQGLANITGINGGAAEVVAWTTSTISVSSGGAWTTEAPPSLGTTAIDLVSRAAVGPTWLGAGTNLFRRDNGVWTSRPVGVRQQSGQTTPDGDLLGVAATSGVVRYFNDTTAAREEQLFSPGTARSVSLTDDGGIAFASNLGAYRLRSGAWGTMDPILQGWAYQPWKYDRFSRLEVGRDGSATLMEPRGNGSNTGPWTGKLDGTGFSPLASSSNAYGLYDVTSTADGYLVGLGDAGVVDAYDTNVVYLDRYIYDIDGNQIGFHTWTIMKPARNGDVLLGGSQELAIGHASGNWSLLGVPGYDLLDLDADASGGVVALATDDNGQLVVRIDAAGTVTALAGSANLGLRDIWVAPTGEIVAVGGSKVLRCPQNTCTVETVAANLYTISGTAPDDVFVGGLPNNSSFGALTHWDGTRWFPVRTPSVFVYSLYVDERSFAYLDGSTRVYGLQRVARW